MLSQQWMIVHRVCRLHWIPPWTSSEKTWKMWRNFSDHVSRLAVLPTRQAYVSIKLIHFYFHHLFPCVSGNEHVECGLYWSYCISFNRWQFLIQCIECNFFEYLYTSICCVADCLPLLIQQNVDGSTFFNRSWAEFKVGFNDSRGNFWLGNDLLHQLTTSGSYKLWFDLHARDDGVWYYAEYITFIVQSEASNYMIRVSGYSGNAVNAFVYHDWMMFTTYDRDNDLYNKSNCAVYNGGGFWYKTCAQACVNTIVGRGQDFKWYRRPTYPLPAIIAHVADVLKPSANNTKNFTFLPLQLSIRSEHCIFFCWGASGCFTPHGMADFFHEVRKQFDECVYTVLWH